MIRKEHGIEYEVIKAKKHSKINLLFVHGTGCNKKFLRSLAVLFEDYNCYLIDLPGHGNSDNTGYSFDNYVRAISKLIEKLSNVVIIGHSLGGTLAVKTASLNFKQVIGAVVLNGASSWYKLDKNLVEKAHKGILDMKWLLEASGHLDNKDVQDSLNSMEPEGNTIVDLLIDEVINVDSCLKKISIPVLIVGGADEILALPEYSEKLDRKIKHSKLVLISGGKHMSCVDQKYKVKGLVCDFITNNILKGKEYELV